MCFDRCPYVWYCALLPIVFAACASPKSPAGGPRDETPPVILAESSTPNHQTLFKDKVIVLTFDEWITLKDVHRQLVVSPLMPGEPEIKQKGKTIQITLPDSLKPETTYTLNFGNAIADLNEGNILENFAFVFSTGAALDSGRLSGIVMDAVNLKPVDGVWVMLYPTGEDSAVYKRKPEYLAKTNKEGKWSLANIRSDSFQVVALKDENLNFLYDQQAELFGWQEEIVHIGKVVLNLPPIHVFPRPGRIAIRDISHSVPGWIKIVVDAERPKPVPVLDPVIDDSMMSWSGDTLHVWYSPTIRYSGYAILLDDSTQIRTPPAAASSPTALRISMVSGRLHPHAIGSFVTDIPLTEVDTSRITLKHDTLGFVPFVLTKDSQDIRKINIGSSWKEQTKYQLMFLPGAVTDFWGRTQDTIRHNIVVNARDQFGDLTLRISGLDSMKQYIVLLKTGEQILERFVIQQLAAVELKKSGMMPGKYIAEVVEDRNRNGTWDTGDYPSRRQPERKMIYILENLRAGWELDSALKWDASASPDKLK